VHLLVNELCEYQNARAAIKKSIFMLDIHAEWVACFFMQLCKKFRSSFWALQCYWCHIWMKDVMFWSCQHLDSWYSCLIRSRSF